MKAVGAEAYLKNNTEHHARVRLMDATMGEQLSTTNDRMDRLTTGQRCSPLTQAVGKLIVVGTGDDVSTDRG